jgi:hypothetical protein
MSSRTARRQARALRIAHADIKVGPIKGMQAKGKPSKLAHAESAPVRKSDVHAIQ